MARKWWGGDAGFWKPELGDTSGVGVGGSEKAALQVYPPGLVEFSSDKLKRCFLGASPSAWVLADKSQFPHRSSQKNQQFQL